MLLMQMLYSAQDFSHQESAQHDEHHNAKPRRIDSILAGSRNLHDSHDSRCTTLAEPKSYLSRPRE